MPPLSDKRHVGNGWLQYVYTYPDRVADWKHELKHQSAYYTLHDWKLEHSE